MSIPRNHHYVSQIHIKQFFNKEENLIYLYDKMKCNFFSKNTTKSLFSEKDSNTRFINHKKDYCTLEEDLNSHFESKFPENFKIIEDFISNEILTESVNNALLFFAKYGIIGDMRTPQYKQNVDDNILEAFQPIIHQCTPQLKQKLQEMFAFKQEAKYSNVIEYSNIAEQIIEKIGNLVFAIIIPNNPNDYFLLPDCSSFTSREKINIYFNPDIKEIAYIAIPLSSKIFIHFYSEKLFDNSIPHSIIKKAKSEEVLELNLKTLNFSYTTVGCESELYLRSFIEKVHNQ
ncbi:DUF4238 domain-containing protein [Bacteroides sp. 14(A)]|uniref:DUF4238 domain-containing protein n=1 Tax=Bacteroides sp. 14(A) TaxID=1163670 RepID=UPI00047274F2|nr:DUF4238 domain-containing protein [Bacteroides sp. 14(A)]